MTIWEHVFKSRIVPCLATHSLYKGQEEREEEDGETVPRNKRWRGFSPFNCGLTCFFILAEIIRRNVQFPPGSRRKTELAPFCAPSQRPATAEIYGLKKTRRNGLERLEHAASCELRCIAVAVHTSAYLDFKILSYEVTLRVFCC